MIVADLLRKLKKAAAGCARKHSGHTWRQSGFYL